MAKRDERVWPLAVLSLIWYLSFCGIAAMAEYGPVGVFAGNSMFLSGGALALVEKFRHRSRVKWKKKSLPPAATATVFYALYVVSASYLAVYSGVVELAAVSSLQSLAFLIGFSLVKELYIRQRTILCVGITSIGAVCAMEIAAPVGSLFLWCVLLLGTLLCWTLYVILTLDLMEAYPVDFILARQNLTGGALALSTAVLDPSGFSIPGGVPVLFFLSGACLWGLGMPLLLKGLQTPDKISSDILFSAVPICCMLACRLVFEGGGSRLQILGLCLLCAGTALAYFDMRGASQKRSV